MTVKTLKEAEERIRKAMEPPATQGGQGFSSGIQRIRQSASLNRPMLRGQQLPTAR